MRAGQSPSLLTPAVEKPFTPTRVTGPDCGGLKNKKAEQSAAGNEPSLLFGHERDHIAYLPSSALSRSAPTVSLRRSP